MPLMEHLIELRRRALDLVRARSRLCGIVVFIFYNPVLHFLSAPYQDVTRNTAGMRTGLQARSSPTRSPRSSCG